MNKEKKMHIENYEKCFSKNTFNVLNLLFYIDKYNNIIIDNIIEEIIHLTFRYYYGLKHKYSLASFFEIYAYHIDDTNLLIALDYLHSEIIYLSLNKKYSYIFEPNNRKWSEVSSKINMLLQKPLPEKKNEKKIIERVSVFVFSFFNKISIETEHKYQMIF